MKTSLVMLLCVWLDLFMVCIDAATGQIGNALFTIGIALLCGLTMVFYRIKETKSINETYE